MNLSTQDNIKLLKQLESGFQITSNLNKYLSKTTNQARNKYLDFLIDPIFEGVNRLFVLSLKGDDGLESHKQYCLANVKMKDHNVMIDERSFFDQPIKKDLKTKITYERLQQIRVMITQLDVY